MAYAMTKQGSLDNCVTYEFICDTVTDMNAIENRYRTIGTVAIVLQGSGGLEVYIAGSDKQWNSLGAMGTGGSSSSTAGLSIHICGQNEISEGLPNISEPEENTIYLTPAEDSETGNLYEEYIYVNNNWEKFGNGGQIDLSTYALKSELPDISGKADKADTVLNTTLSMGRKSGTTVGECSTALGSDVTASGEYSHAEGYHTVSSGSGSHAEGKKTANGWKSYGGSSYNYGASGEASHSEGYNTISQGSYSHTEGINTLAVNNACHAEGHSSVSYGSYSHAEGCDTQAYGQYSHAEGYSSNSTSTSYGARGKADHVEGYNTFAHSGTSSSYYGAHAEGYETKATGNASHAEGRGSTASGAQSHAEGYQTTASTLASHAEGYQTTASGSYSHAEGYNTTASDTYSHAEGYYTNATESYSHAEGNATTASGQYSHAEGNNVNAGTGGPNNGIHAFGCYNIGFDSKTITITDEVAVEWEPNKAYPAFSCALKHTDNGVTTYYVPHNNVPAYIDPTTDFYQQFWHRYELPSGTDPETISEWDKDTLYPKNSIVKKRFGGEYMYFQNHMEMTTTYYPLTAASYYHTQELNSQFNTYPCILEEVGNGTSSSALERSNARTLDLSGNEYLMGDIYVGCNADSTGGTKLIRIPAPPAIDGTYTLQVVVSSGTPTYSWV